MPAVGIDLGTTNSAVALMRGRPVIVEDFTGQRWIPSAVGWDPDHGELVVGIDAKESADIYGTVLSIKRLMGTQQRVMVGPHEWLPEEVSAEILKVLKKQVEEKTGEAVTEAIITVPAYFQMAAMAATKRAGELAGLTVQQLLAEPSAAVMAYGPQDDERILVYDLGGGTFDVTVLDYFAGVITTKAVFGNNRLGGADFDNRLVKHFVDLIRQEHGITLDLKTDIKAQLILKQRAEEAKIRLSRLKRAPVSIGTVTEVDGRPIGLKTEITVEEFNDLIRDLVEGTFVEVEKALKHAELDKSDIDTILLVGGSTYVPLVQKMVRDYFGKDPNRTVNPDLAVAMGAAASLVDTGANGPRHVVTVGYIPETTPETEIEVEGRTTAGSQVQVTGGAQAVTTEADSQGGYHVIVPLNQGVNSLTITAISPDHQRASMSPEPVQHDPDAVVRDTPPAPPASRLARGMCISCNLPIDQKRIIHHAALILQPQTELPCSFTAGQFSTAADNQQELRGEIVEGDLPIPDLNTRLGDICLRLPPNVPAGEQVLVHFSVDESYILTAELECANRRCDVQINLKSPSTRKHVLDELEDLLTDIGDHIRPEERAGLQRLRLTVEDLSQQFRDHEKNGDGEALWGCYERLQAEVAALRGKMADARRKYA